MSERKGRIEAKMREIFEREGRPTFGTLIAQHQNDPEWTELKKLPPAVSQFPVDGSHTLPRNFWDAGRAAGVSVDAMGLLTQAISQRSFDMLWQAAAELNLHRKRLMGSRQCKRACRRRALTG